MKLVAAPLLEAEFERLTEIYIDNLIARFGGEEFAILLPQTQIRGAEHVAERILSAVEELGLPHAGSPTAPRSCCTAWAISWWSHAKGSCS